MTRKEALDILNQLCLTVLNLKEQLAQAEEKYESLASRLSISKHKGPGFSLRYQSDGIPRETIKKELLQQNGVSIKVIEKSTVKTWSKPFYVLTKDKKDKKKGEKQ